MSDVQRIDTVILGAGQAGLSMSYYLTAQRREHIVLERDSIGSTWKNQRWDSFRLVTPNWQLRLPGFPYQGNDPDGFATRAEVVRYLEDYAAYFKPPVRTGITMHRVTHGSSARYRIETNASVFEADQVVMATGAFPVPRMPAMAARLPAYITQFHASEYRNPRGVPPGAVLVVGSGQSGTQIACELARDGRQVYLSVGSSPRAIRRYRGRDADWWLDRLGEYDRTVDERRAAGELIRGTPYMDIDLPALARETGMVLLGRLVDTDGRVLTLARDLNSNLQRATAWLNAALERFDRFAREHELPVDPGPGPSPGPGPGLRVPEPPVLPEPDSLLLSDSGIRSVIWATGYRHDPSRVPLPIWDQNGQPIQKRGITPLPGFYVLGLFCMHTLKSGLLFGVGEDAAFLAEHMEASDRLHREQATRIAP